MTLKEFLETVGIHWDECINSNNPILNFNILIEHNENFAIGNTNTSKANLIDIDNNQETITLKYKYKG